MKLAELMNDDTCQILLAIIVGIVICYFIFGSCSSGSCSAGSCNRDGFSVGGPCTGRQVRDDSQLTSCDSARDQTGCVMAGCTWTRGCSDAVTLDGESYFTELTNECQLGDSASGARAVDHFDQEGFFDTSYEFSEGCCDLVQNIPEACARPDRTIDQITDVDGSTLRRDLDAINVNICSQRQPAAPPPPDRYKNILNNMANAILSLLSPNDEIRADGTGLDDYNFLISMTSLDAETTKGNFDIIKRISVDKNIYFHICMNDQNLSTGVSILSSWLLHWNNTKIEKEAKNDYYLQTAADVTGLAVTTDGQTLDKYEGCPSWAYCELNAESHTYKITPNKQPDLNLGNLFGTVSLAPLEVKKDIYCASHDINVGSDGSNIKKYDPLLKIKSPKMMLAPPAEDGSKLATNYANCAGEGVFADVVYDVTHPENSDFNVNTASSGADGADAEALDADSIIAARGGAPGVIYSGWYENVKARAGCTERRGSSTRDCVSYFNTNTLRNNRELIVRDNDASINIETFRKRSSKYIYVYFPNETNSDLYFDSDGHPVSDSSMTNITQFTIPSSDPYELLEADGTGQTGSAFPYGPDISGKTLMSVYGMSQPLNGEIYHNNNEQEVPWYNREYSKDYFKNLIHIQYLITRIYLIGTDEYASELSIYNKEPHTPILSLTDRTNIDATILNQDQNPQCHESGNDYLLLVFIDKSPLTEPTGDFAGDGGHGGNPDGDECTGVEGTEYKIFHSWANGNNTGITQDSSGNNVICSNPISCTEDIDCQRATCISRSDHDCEDGTCTDGSCA
jgi:hypothetical protein